MHIITASDQNYVVGVLALISSASRHNPQARFTVMTTAWSRSSHAKLARLASRIGVRVATIEVSAESLEKFPITRAHLTASTYARLFIPDLLPTEDRVIYMDCDMLVTGSLDSAWGCDLNGKVLAAVRCPTPTRNFAAALDLPIEQYFNAGFLVLNLALWRAEHLAQRCFDALAAPHCRYLSQDESALNDVARGRVSFLDAGFNLYALDRVWQEPLAAPQNIRVIHYITRPKPWNGLCPFGSLWLDEVEAIPELEGFEPEAEHFQAKLTRWNRFRKAMMGHWAGKPRYARHAEAFASVHQVLVPRYLATGQFFELP